MNRFLNASHVTRHLFNGAACTVFLISLSGQVHAEEPQQETAATIQGVHRLNQTAVDILLSGNKRMTLDFYGDHIVRIFRDDAGGIIRDPQAEPEAKILVDHPRRVPSQLRVSEGDDTITITTGGMSLELDRKSGLMKAANTKTGNTVLQQAEPVRFEKRKTTLAFKERDGEYFYGGGVQNGRFSHKGRVISIENQNSWTDGGVASPTPFYWSTGGYAVMWHTFKKGKYDFGSSEPGIVRLYHEEPYLDVFLMVDDGVVDLLNDFYQLTGHPVLIPKFGFYQGHLNAYNRDYWKENKDGILFEDGKRYKESQKDTEGVKESLNGELDNYQFSARAVIDRYNRHDMPLGWLLPNDGYGAGYGQTDTLDGNIQNLKSLTDYARERGVEIGLWTQSDLHPNPEVDALLQRDLVKEVRDAGVRVLKTDVAWVGAGYSFGLNGITDAAQIMTYYGNNSRPFIISLDGWAGTQRYAGIWTGDQTGGAWEYIRFHIPTYIGSGLSGQPNITSDMDGIFGGKNANVNVRDFQWKTFTPMELNMDGWGANAKYPHVFGEPATSINRMYLKLKSELLPYAYSIAAESVTGKPMIRPIFLEEPKPSPYTLGKATQYQFMYGPWFLVAPVYRETAIDEGGNDIRNGIYLPEGEWIDYMTGDLYRGGKIFNHIDAPLWKLPVFVKNGAIIPMVNPNNNVAQIDQKHRIYEVYPSGESTFTEYDDDGVTEEYRQGRCATTRIESHQAGGNATVVVMPTMGGFDGFEKVKSTEFRINVTEKPSRVAVFIGDTEARLSEASSKVDFQSRENVYYYESAPDLNRFATKGSDFAQIRIIKNPQLHVKVAPVDTTRSAIKLAVEGFRFRPVDRYHTRQGKLNAPANASITDENAAPYTLTPTWDAVPNADYYEIDFNGLNYTTIRDTRFTFEDLIPESQYDFKLRAANKDGYSEWVAVTGSTKSNPLEFAIPGITAETTAENQGNSLQKLFDFVEGDLWHTKYGVEVVPFDLVMDLKTVNQLDKFHYLPRDNAQNGTLLKGSVAYSMDRENWTEAGTFEWSQDNEVKIFAFEGAPSARYIKLHVAEAVGKYGSGKEIYVFKVPGTESYLPGDINNDGRIDENDLTSYTNYTGLRKGDADFEGYISNGDINRNGLIDAYDISHVAITLDGGISDEQSEEDKEADKPDTQDDPDAKDDGKGTPKAAVNKVKGRLIIATDKREYKRGEVIEIRVRGEDLAEVNAMSFALPYDPQSYEYIGIQPQNIKHLQNMTNDRLHTNGVKALYPTFVNYGDKDLLNGSEELFIIKLKARKDLVFDLKSIDGILVDRKLNYVKF